MNDFGKRIVEAIACSVGFLAIIWYMNRENPNWIEIALLTVVFFVVYFIFSIIVDRIIANKKKKNGK